jgi:hypothetical protein
VFALPSGEVLVEAIFFGMETKEFLRESVDKQLQCAVHEDHFYVPTWWIIVMKPKFRRLCAELEQKAREMLQAELEERALSGE